MSPDPPVLSFHPPLLNAACPWATTLSDLQTLHASPSTGAITTRTSLPSGFVHNDAVHRFVFFDPAASVTNTKGGDVNSASLNSLGYSPNPLSYYEAAVGQLGAAESGLDGEKKMAIISVTGSPAEIGSAYARLAKLFQSGRRNIAMEINLSCPNIPGLPPPAYSSPAIAACLDTLPSPPLFPVGVKTPPYTHSTQFDMLVAGINEYAGVVSFVTATNTLGSCMVFGDGESPELAGGMAGSPLHPLALGNVRALRTLLDKCDRLQHVRIIGVGGVRDADGYRRMRRAGADFIALATALGQQGVGVFEKIEKELEGDWECTPSRRKDKF